MRHRLNDLLAKLQGSWMGAVAACVLYPMMYLPHLIGAYVNALICERLINAWPRIGGVGLFKSAAALTRELVESGRFKTVALGGNRAEKDQFLEQYRPEHHVILGSADGTSSQAEQVVWYAKARRLRQICLITHESLLTRAVLTVLKELRKQGLCLPVYCEAYLAPERLELRWYEVTLASANEALSLLRYQRRGHVSTCREALRYQQSVDWGSPAEGTLFVIL